MPRKPRVVLYLRLSESDDNSTSIARQEADLRVRADREDWEVVAVLIDDGVSGGKSREKALKALEMIRTGAAEVLAVWKFDRWSRQGLGAIAQLIDALDMNPKALFIADRDGLSSAQPAWRIIASVLAEVARMERENTQTRVRSSIAALKKSGRYSGGRTPYGYESAEAPDGVGRVLVINPAEAEVVREMAERVLAGETLHKIMLDLNDRKVPAKLGGRWTKMTILQTLTNQAIVGRVTHQGELLRDDDGLPVEVWPPVLDLVTWHRIRAERDLDKPASERRKKRRRSRRLSGIPTCGDCGRALYAMTYTPTKQSYGCAAPSNGHECGGVSIKADALDEWVTGRFLNDFGHREVIKWVEELPDLAALAEVDAAITATASQMTADDSDIAKLASRLTGLKERRAELKSRAPERVVKLVSTGQTYAEVWETASEEQRNAMLAENISVLAIRKGKRGGNHEIDWNRVTLIFQPERLESDAGPGYLRVYAEAA